MEAPRLFVSYSWTSPDHEARVVQLSEELRESGVDVILDKWDLREGNDAIAFMEQMVTNADVKKVILVCDEAYAKKADSRTGGVGTEAQIISPELYADQSQDKFVAVIFERDSVGNAHVPTYYRSRIYIDLSDPASYSDNFDQLLRWIYDKPLYVKPDLGSPPGFLSEGSAAVVLGTTTRFRRALDSIRAGRDNALPAVAEYLEHLASQFESLRLDPSTDPFDDAVVESIAAFEPYRNEAIDVFLALALYLDGPESAAVLHRFFEQLIPFLDRPEHVSAYKEWDYDNYRYVVHELYLYAVAAFVRYERFDTAARLMSQEFYVPGNSDYGRDAMVPYDILRQHMLSLEHRNRRLELNRASVRADLLKQGNVGVSVELRHLMQADFILFMRSALAHGDDYWRWYPDTLVWTGHFPAALEVFARSKSRAYFERSKVLLGVASKEDLVPLLQAWAEDKRGLPGWGFDRLNPVALLGFENIASID